jgi:primosomal protein N' (replication factor Y) (superfamily II helicase)
MADQAPAGQGHRAGVQVLVDVQLFHLDRPFTYRQPAGVDPLALGTRVKVPFGGRRRVDGWVMGPAAEVPDDAKEILRVVSPLPAFGPRELELARWVADRWAGSLADALRLVLPPRVAAVEQARAKAAASIDPAAADAVPAEPAPAPAPRPAPPALAGLVGAAGEVAWWRPLPGQDRGELIADLVEAVLAAGKGAIVLAPEVAAGSPVADAVRKRFPEAADLAGAADRRRYRHWLELAAGDCRVAIGGRSAVFAPMPELGLIVVDDEASHLLKEQRTPRYHARDVAVHRAVTERAACLLVGTVPSAEAAAALTDRAGGGARWRAVVPDRAAERRAAPLVEVVDPDDEGPSAARLHPRGLRVIRQALARGESAYVLVPRRGPAGEPGSGARTAGQVGAELARVLPRGTPVWRLDREVVEPGQQPPWAVAGPSVVVGTVAGVKDRPPVPGCRTVVVVGADAALGHAEVRTAEDALRTWWRAACWCGPRGAGGGMVLQARAGGHHAVQALVRWEPVHFWRHELPRRLELGFPPARALILVEGPEEGDGPVAAKRLAAALGPGAELLGPAAMGRGWRIIAKVDDAAVAAMAVRPLLAEAAKAGTPRLSVDIDPLEVLAPARPAP